MTDKIKKTLQDYIDNKLSLKIFEDKILSLMSESNMELLDDILEDIAYTANGELIEDKQNNLMTQQDLKTKLEEYLKNL